MRLSTVKSAIFQGDRVYVVEDIQAMVCDVCMEQYYDEEVTDAIRRLTEEGFPSAKVTREILVPVFSLRGVGMIEPESA
jgi:YgiT-type zinc finger domain-containing protein